MQAYESVWKHFKALKHIKASHLGKQRLHKGSHIKWHTFLVGLSVYSYAYWALLTLKAAHFLVGLRADITNNEWAKHVSRIEMCEKAWKAFKQGTIRGLRDKEA